MTFVELCLDFFRKLLYDDVDVPAEWVIVVEPLGYLVHPLRERERRGDRKLDEARCIKVPM